MRGAVMMKRFGLVAATVLVLVQTHFRQLPRRLLPENTAGGPENAVGESPDAEM